MATTLKHVFLSKEASSVIQAWVREVNLRDSRGRPVTLKKACEIIIDDFAEALSCVDDGVFEDELEFRRRAVQGLIL
jgi:hypothetical protein